MHSLKWNVFLILIAVQSLTAQDNGLTAYWHFDSSTGTAAIESRKQVEDKIQGNVSYTPGVRGNGIKFRSHVPGTLSPYEKGRFPGRDDEPERRGR